MFRSVAMISHNGKDLEKSQNIVQIIKSLCLKQNGWNFADKSFNYILFKDNILIQNKILFQKLFKGLFKELRMVISSLASGRCGSNFEDKICKLITQNSSLRTRCEFAHRWMPQNLANEKSTLVHVMTWGHQQQAITWANVYTDPLHCCQRSMMLWHYKALQNQ